MNQAQNNKAKSQKKSQTQPSFWEGIKKLCTIVYKDLMYWHLVRETELALSRTLFSMTHRNPRICEPLISATREADDFFDLSEFGWKSFHCKLRYGIVCLVAEQETDVHRLADSYVGLDVCISLKTGIIFFYHPVFAEKYLWIVHDHSLVPQPTD